MSVKITKDTVFGEIKEEKYPDNEDIIVRFNTDMSAGMRKKIRSLMPKEGEEPSAAFLEAIVSATIGGWNLVDKNEKQLPISTDTIDNLLPKALADWILKTAWGFLAENGMNKG